MLDFNGAPDRLWWGGDVSEVYSGSDLVWSAESNTFIRKAVDFGFSSSWREWGEVTLRSPGRVFAGMKYQGGSPDVIRWGDNTPELRFSSGADQRVVSLPQHGAYTHMGRSVDLPAGTWKVEGRRPNASSSAFDEIIIAASPEWTTIDVDFTIVTANAFNSFATVKTPPGAQDFIAMEGIVGWPGTSSTGNLPQLRIGGHTSRNIGETGSIIFAVPGTEPASHWEVAGAGDTLVGYVSNNTSSASTILARQIFKGQVHVMRIPD